MDVTSLSLLDRIKSNSDDQAWLDMDALYRPFLLDQLTKWGAQHQDAEDVAQDVLEFVRKKLPEFHRERTGSFRAWLRAITLRLNKEHRRRQRRQARALPEGGSAAMGRFDGIEDSINDLEKEWDQAHERFKVRYALTKIKGDISSDNWKMFFRVMIEERSHEEVAKEFGVSKSAIYTAISRVKRKLKPELEKLLD